MLSEIQTLKFTRMFQIRDADGNGTLEREDLKAINLRLKSLLDLSEDEYFSLRQRSMISWEHLRQIADKDGDGKISLPEWLFFCDDIVNNKDNFELFLVPMVDFFLGIFDRDHDGTYSYAELKLFLDAYKILDIDGLHQAIWSKLDINKRGHLTREDVMVLVQQFCFGQDLREPGNFAFGPMTPEQEQELSQVQAQAQAQAQAQEEEHPELDRGFDSLDAYLSQVLAFGLSPRLRAKLRGVLTRALKKLED